MMNLVRLGDDTDHGGKVITASTKMRFDGRFVARKGDEVSCPRHPDVKPNVIVEGDASMTDNGVPIARHGHKATCGCALISSLAASA
ncbi:PAAR domain-containing protein [Burkholderia glumae]|uniref:PAAR domain-containing protein n=1 Tax=Burkholderia glumae TaxID=337 RepID=UPI0005C28632|nr:PAAR domain-containing protein [Burkholderia glumae]MCM2494760.1 PAAR domain-containing protein [Burkholderia glumae]MCM2545624.1 PAAR domain-containing protein [Burkholderia glumae]MCR1769310.1 PAAR domain-containing protein [Burkholderia glumae]PJO20404.1 PAAR domain-containing protein [Burkholderia glumae AU6208]PJO20407.1 PAAR domain-containing protein [Burkholderia glumae AU6208]